jgi:hypothetical protein
MLNADSLPNKITELRALVASLDPSPNGIGVTEAKPKNSRYVMDYVDYSI